MQGSRARVLTVNTQRWGICTRFTLFHCPGVTSALVGLNFTDSRGKRDVSESIQQRAHNSSVITAHNAWHNIFFQRLLHGHLDAHRLIQEPRSEHLPVHQALPARAAAVQRSRGRRRGNVQLIVRRPMNHRQCLRSWSSRQDLRQLESPLSFLRERWCGGRGPGGVLGPAWEHRRHDRRHHSGAFCWYHTGLPSRSRGGASCRKRRRVRRWLRRRFGRRSRGWLITGFTGRRGRRVY